MRKPFHHYKTPPDIIARAVMMCIRFPLSLRQVEDLLSERGLDVEFAAMEMISR
jgi:putative transposase